MRSPMSWKPLSGGGGNRTRVRGRTGQSVYKLRLPLSFARRPVGSRPTSGLAILWCRASGDWLSLGAEPVSDAANPSHGPSSERRASLRVRQRERVRCSASHLRCVPVVLGGRPGTSACSSAGVTTTSKPGRPRMLSSYCSCVIEVSPVADAVEEQLSLDVFNATWPHMRFALPEVQSYKRALLAHADLLAREDGAILGSGFAAVHPGLPDEVRALVTVPPATRRRGAGTALYEALSAWARERGVDGLESVVADDDAASLAFA